MEHESEYLQRTERYIALLHRHERLVSWRCALYARFRTPYALDLEQEVRARIWCTLDNLQADASEGEEHQWVVNQIRSVLDHAGRSRSVKAIPLERMVEPSSNDTTAEALRLLDEALALLPDGDSRPLRLLLDGYSVDEIADRLQLAPHTVEKHLAKARRRLRTIIEQIKNDQL